MVLEKDKKSDHMKPTNLSHEERVSTLTNVVIFCGLHGESGMILSLTNFSGRLKRCTIPFGLSRLVMIGLSGQKP